MAPSGTEDVDWLLGSHKQDMRSALFFDHLMALDLSLLDSS